MKDCNYNHLTNLLYMHDDDTWYLNIKLRNSSPLTLLALRITLTEVLAIIQKTKTDPRLLSTLRENFTKIAVDGAVAEA